ncbi:hypothetical protein [Corynebacterium vitaeruminis]|uniref:hypothetical protein n=1 Tax=Corynebacterium vitaeruminis TaxID=38305 RepID=UPI0012DCB648|nr:hypothetical protein [Corynebacterium vitaeruminis]
MATTDFLLKLSRAKHLLWTSGGQLLNFVAMFLPIVAGQARQLAFLTFPLAVSYLVSRTSSLAFHVEYLRIDDRFKNAAIKCAIVGLLFASGVLLAASGVFWFLPSLQQATPILLSIATLTLSQGAYFVSTTVLLRNSLLQEFGISRVLYGCINVVSTFIAVFLFSAEWGLVLSTILTFLTSAAIQSAFALRSGCLSRGSARTSNGEVLHYLRFSRSSVQATLFSDLSSQTQALLTPMMGEFQSLWAAAIRISGGMGTVGQQVLAPSFEVKISQLVRNHELESAVRLSRKVLILGVLFSAAAILFTFLLFSFSHRELMNHDRAFVLLIFVMNFASIAGSLTVKIPYLLHRSRPMSIWAATRLLLMIPLFWFSGESLITLLACITVFFWLLEVWINSYPAPKVIGE